jgi:type IV pilus assembly protein PilY1
MLVAIDDSGSMAEETLLLSNDGAAWWHAQNANGDDATVCTTGFTGCGTDPATATNIASANTINFNYVGNGSAAWRKYGYLIPTGDESFYSIPPIGQFAYYRSSFYNPGYFDVSKVYKPWTNYSTTVFADAVPAAAIFDPTTNSTTMDLTAYRASNVSLATASVAQPMTQTACTGLAPTYAAGYNFRAFAGMVLPQGTCYRPSGGNWTFVSATSYTVPANNNNGVDQGTAIAVLYFPATFYLPKNVALPAGYGYTGAPTTNGLAPDGVTQLYGYEIKPANFTNTAAYTLAMQNFANWFQYYRKRNLAVRGGFGAAFADVKRLRIGQYTINKRSFGNMLDMSTAADKNTLYSNVYGLTFGGGTPNKEAVGYMIDRYKATDSTAPITDACQQNFGVLFTDGFANASTVSVGGSAVGNTDGDQGSPFADKVSDTMADIVMYGYKNNIRPDLTPGLVPPEAMCSTDPTNPMLDCRKDPHMGFYAITLGGRGFTYGVNTVQTNDPYNNVPTWPTTFANRNPTAVDDLWHAAINGRGSLLLATTPQSIADKFKQILDSIVGKTGAASAVAANAGALSSGSRLYQARFNSADWSGTLSSLRLSTGSTGACPTVAVGNPCPVNSTAGDWEAGNVLNNKAATSRSIITLRDAGPTSAPHSRLC